MQARHHKDSLGQNMTRCQKRDGPHIHGAYVTNSLEVDHGPPTAIEIHLLRTFVPDLMMQGTLQQF